MKPKRNALRYAPLYILGLYFVLWVTALVSLGLQPLPSGRVETIPISLAISVAWRKTSSIILIVVLIYLLIEVGRRIFIKLSSLAETKE